MTDGRLVCGVTADHQNRIVDSDELRDLPFQLTVNRFFTGHQSACRDAGAVPLDRIGGGLGDVWMAAQPEVVVACKADQFLSVDDRRVGDNAVVVSRL